MFNAHLIVHCLYLYSFAKSFLYISNLNPYYIFLYLNTINHGYIVELLIILL